jgi:diaminopimelate epimerase
MGATFLKVEGLGNDFVLLDLRHLGRDAFEAEARRLGPRAPALCDRRLGIGGDGLLLVGPPERNGSDATMRVINHDGSRPQMCGNGLRCVALLLAADLGRTAIVVDTDAGVRRCDARPEGPPAPGCRGEVTVDMGPGRDLGTVRAAAFDRPLAAVSMGNPHAIVFTGPGEDPEALARAHGPALEVDAAFPEGTNVEFCAAGERELVLWVWERGCGITAACGTGACATAFAATHAGLAPWGAPIAVRLPGGRLEITVPQDPEAGIRMRGPARVVFAGALPPA